MNVIGWFRKTGCPQLSITNQRPATVFFPRQVNKVLPPKIIFGRNPSFPFNHTTDDDILFE